MSVFSTPLNVSKYNVVMFVSNFVLGIFLTFQKNSGYKSICSAMRVNVSQWFQSNVSTQFCCLSTLHINLVAKPIRSMHYSNNPKVQTNRKSWALYFNKTNKCTTIIFTSGSCWVPKSSVHGCQNCLASLYSRDHLDQLAPRRNRRPMSCDRLFLALRADVSYIWR